jgi:glucose-1-phosphate thymidylyltransferase
MEVVVTSLVGLIPAAGQAKRLVPLPGSKELLPVAFTETIADGATLVRPKVVSQYVLEAMNLAGVDKAIMVLGKDKLDILRFYGNGGDFGIHLAYLVVDRLVGMPYTLNQAFPWLSGETVLFGMPDTIFTPRDAFAQLLRRHRATRAAVTLGLFPTNQPHRFGMVVLGAEDRIIQVIDKPEHTDLNLLWGIACWSPQFTAFLNEYLSKSLPSGREVVLSEVFQAAVDADLLIHGVRFEEGEYLDVGTPEDFRSAVQRFSR